MIGCDISWIFLYLLYTYFEVSDYEVPVKKQLYVIIFPNTHSQIILLGRYSLCAIMLHTLFLCNKYKHRLTVQDITYASEQ